MGVDDSPWVLPRSRPSSTVEASRASAAKEPARFGGRLAPRV